MNVDIRLLKFIDDRLERMLSTPEMWGSNESVELQVLQLLELRAVLLSTAESASRWRDVQSDYVRFLGNEFPGAPPEPLSRLVAAGGRDAEFNTLLARFVRDQVGTLDAGLWDRVAASPISPTDTQTLRERLRFRNRGALGTKRIDFPDSPNA